jgi:MFS family permease
MLAAGRRRTLGMACAATLLFGVSSCAAPAFWYYFVLRCLCGAGSAGIAQAAFLLATEAVGPGWRATAVLGTGVCPPHFPCSSSGCMA